MNNTDKKQMAIDIEQIYSINIRQLYIRYPEYTTAEVRNMFANWVLGHNHQKNMELLAKRSYRAKKTKKLKAELQALKVKNELDNFTNNL